jgi:hypothetical protein
MAAIAFHIRLRLLDDRVIAPTPESRRALSRVILSKGGPYKLIAYSVPDNHLHIEAGCDRPAAGRFARQISLSLRRHLDLKAPFAPAYIAPIQNGKHLYNAFRYILNQQRHHGLECDLFQEGSNLPDLLGLRLLGRYTISNVRTLLPRIRPQHLLDYLGVRRLRPIAKPPQSQDMLAKAGMMAGAIPALEGNHRDVVRVRRAIVALASSHISHPRLAEALCVTPRTIRRLQKAQVEPRLVQAIRLQLSLMEQRMGHRSVDDPFCNQEPPTSAPQ